jgi:uncharacterized pyridoxamine 5'-phosphate oxidase family protein
MNEVIEFLNDCGVFFLATVDGDQPKVRPYGFVMDYDGKLCLCTNNKKPSYAQMKANPAVEISATKDGKWVRLQGNAVFCTTPESQAKALEAMPGLARMYAVGDGLFEIFAIENGVADFCSMAGDNHQVIL